MSQQLLFLNTKSLSHTLSVYVPDMWDYWEIDGKRVNFNIKKINNPEYPNFVGYSIILWVFNLYYVWRKPND
jgi:hypothetical protein